MKNLLFFLFISITATIGILTLSKCNPESCKFEYSNKIQTGDSLDVFVFLGQSNMVGAGDICALSDLKFPGDVQMINRSYSPKRLSKKKKHSISNYGPEFFFAKQLAKHRANNTSLFLKVAIGGSDVAQWNQGENYCDTILTYLKYIRKNFSPKTYTFFWAHGESDVKLGTSREKYQSELNQLLFSIRKEIESSQFSFIMNIVNVDKYGLEKLSDIQTAQLSVCESHTSIHCISSEDLDMQKDKVHYSVEGLKQLGEYYFNTYQKIIN